MADNLTKQIKEELEKRGTAATSTQINEALEALSGKSPQPLTGSLFTQSSEPDIEPQQPAQDNMFSSWLAQAPEERSTDSGVLNAVGAGLWTFADTAAFGLPGAFTEEEEFIDFDDPYAKWTSAVGGFAGFVAGAPMKLGGKILQKTAKQLVKTTGKQHVDEVIKGMALKGQAKGLTDETIKEVAGGYRALVNRAQVNTNIRGQEFVNKTEDFLNAYLDRGIKTGSLSTRDAANIKNMFTDNVFKRPIQDFYGIIAEKGIFASRPKAQRVLAHLLNDSVMFGLIDTAFEAVSMIEDHEFDWTAPLWGIGIGVGFSQLAWLKPKGNAASWKKDFTQGAKAAFARKDIYKNLTKDQLDATAKFFGESAKKQRFVKEAGDLKDDMPIGEIEDYIVNIKYKGKEVTGVNLLDDNGILNQISGTFKGESKQALISFLESKKKKYGKELMGFANKEALENLSAVWPRMMLGGVLFNAHSFSDMAFKGHEMGVHELLPHFLIGAWIQRHQNPAKHDMRSREINQIRANLMTLGMGPGQLSSIPTFDIRRSSIDSPFRDAEMSKIVEKAKEIGILSDSPEITGATLKKGEKSINSADVENPKFDYIYDALKQHGETKEIKIKDDISVKEADALLEVLYSIDPSLRKGTAEDVALRLDKARLTSTKGFEQRFVDIVDTIEKSDVNDELGITSERVPMRVRVSEELKQRARDGLLTKEDGTPLLVDENGNTLDGIEAERALINKMASFNSVVKTTELIGKRDHNTSIKQQEKDVTSEQLLRKIYDTIELAEFRIQEEFPENRHFVDKFNFHDSFTDYIDILSRNAAIRSSEAVAEIFRPSYRERNQVASMLDKIDVLYTPDGRESLLRKDIKNLRFDEESFGENTGTVAEARRFLSRLLTIQSAAGGYKVVGDEAPSSKIIKGEDIFAVREFLSDRGFNIKASLQKDWMHNQIVDYIIQDRISKTKLTLADTDALFQLSELNMVSFEGSVEGRAAGFMMKKINPDSFEKGSWQYKDALKYNDFVDRIVVDGKGLVNEEAGKLRVIDNDLLRAINKKMVSEGGKVDGVIALTKFMNLLPSTKTSTASLRKQIESFLESGLGHQRMMGWLTEAGVLIKPGGRGRGQYKIDMDKLNKELVAQLEKNMDVYGYDQKNSESRYEEIERRMKSHLLEDVLEKESTKQISIQEFWKKYQWEKIDYSTENSKEQSERFQQLIYKSKDNLLVNKDIVTTMLKGMYVENHNGDLAKLVMTPKQRTEAYLKGEPVLQPKAMKKISRTFFDDFISLLTKQRAQIEIDVLQYKHGNVVKEKDVVQFSRMDKLYRDIGIKPYYINPIAPVYLTVDGRYVRRKDIDIFSADSKNLDKETKEQSEGIKKEFLRLMNVKTDIQGEPIDGQGISVFRVGKGIDGIAIEKSQLKNMGPKWEEYVNKYGDDSRINETHRKEDKEILRKINEDEFVSDGEYEKVLHRLTYSEMLTGSDGDQLYIDFLNSKNTSKISGRIKLFQTKKFVRQDGDFIQEISNGYRLLGRKKAADILDSIVKADGFGVSVWNDEMLENTVRVEVEKQVRDNFGADYKEWVYDDVIGNSHKGVSAFDSISFVSKKVMTFAHAIQGHNPNSKNPIKPVISSGGKDAPLLLGKTLFLYSKNLESFFRNNPNIDILLTKSGAKALNETSGLDNQGRHADLSLINRPWSYFSGDKTGLPIGEGKIRKIPLDALGIMPGADKDFVPAAMGMSDYNYARNVESANLFNSLYLGKLSQNLEGLKYAAEDPIALRKFIIDEIAEEGMIPNLEANQGLSHINNLVWYSSFSKDANPMSYSSNVTKNKLYTMYVNSLVNNYKSSINQHDAENSDRFGGQSIMIQTPDVKNRLKSTLVTKNGKMVMRGEVRLSHREQFLPLSNLHQNGFQMRFVRGEEVLNMRQVAEEYADNSNIPKKQRDKFVEDAINSWQGGTLGQIHGIIDGMNNSFNSNIQVGVIVNRKPRTRPNDLALMGLKGFLEETYGNSIQLGSLDVVNVFEGDYDVDKADYFFSHKPEMYDHVQRTSQFWVQGVDPSNLRPKTEFNFDGPADIERTNRWSDIADAEQWTKNIGQVQKVPRTLGALEKLGVRLTNLDDPFLLGGDLKRTIKDVKDGVWEESESTPKLILGNKNTDYRIFLDYENLDYFTRSALETQYIIDGDGQLNPDIANNLRIWRDDFLFPDKSKSISVEEASKKGSQLINNMRSRGTDANGKRIRIFRKVIKRKDGVYEESDLSILDKAILKEMLGQYNSFLNSTGKTMWENSGEQRSPRYDDFINASEQWSNFNKNISNNLYYRLRRRRIPNTNKKWYQDKEFNEMFGVMDEEGRIGLPKKYKDKYTGKEHLYWEPTRNAIIDDKVNDHGVEVTNGQRGSVIDRIAMNVYESDPFSQTRTKGMTGEVRGIMDDWYSQLMHGNQKDHTEAIDRFQHSIQKGAFDHNNKIKLITSLKRKIFQIGNNYKVPFKTRKASQDKLNKVIKNLESELSNQLIPKEYWKTKSAKDLKKFKYVSVDNQDLKEGAIQYATIENIKSMLPNRGRLTQKAREDLREIKSLRRLFYSNRTNLGEILKYLDESGTTQTLNRQTIEFLKDMPDLSTFYDIETKYLDEAYQKHGQSFIYAFMNPTQRKYDIGVTQDNRIVSIPYQKSKTYKRGLQFLTKKWSDSFDILEKDRIRMSLINMQTIEAQFERFFNRKFDMRNLISENLSDFNNFFPRVEGGVRSLTLADVKFPDLNKDVKRSLTSFGNLKWARDRNRISNGFNLMNDHLIDLYTDLAKLSGKESEFADYLERMHDINAQMIGNGIIDPISYLAERSKLDLGMRQLAQDILSNPKKMGQDNIHVTNIKQNPVYALMGGNDYFKGVSLERTATLNPNRLKEAQNMFTRLNEYRDNLNYASEKRSTELEKMIRDC